MPVLPCSIDICALVFASHTTEIIISVVAAPFDAEKLLAVVDVARKNPLVMTLFASLPGGIAPMDPIPNDASSAVIKAVVAMLVSLSPTAGVGAVGLPVKAGLAMLALLSDCAVMSNNMNCAIKQNNIN